mgnify:CR=1 FL=1
MPRQRRRTTSKMRSWAVNLLRRKPYLWGGGHGSFNDSGYDCSGAVSFALHYAGLLDAPCPLVTFVITADAVAAAG